MNTTLAMASFVGSVDFSLLSCCCPTAWLTWNPRVKGHINKTHDLRFRTKDNLTSRALCLKWAPIRVHRTLNRTYFT